MVASGISALITGFCSKKVAPAVEEGVFGKSELISFILWVVIGNAAAWIVAAPVLDIVMYAEPANKVFVQGLVGGCVNIVTTAIIGTLLCVAYAASKPKQGSLRREN